MLTGGQQPWWNQLSDAVRGVAVEGLVFVKTYRRDGRPPEEVVLMEKAREYDAQAVFFEAGRNGKTLGAAGLRVCRRRS